MCQLVGAVICSLFYTKVIFRIISLCLFNSVLSFSITLCSADNFFQLSYQYSNNRLPSHWFAMTGKTFKFDWFQARLFSSHPRPPQPKRGKKWLRIRFCRTKSRCADLKEIKLTVITALEHTAPSNYLFRWVLLFVCSSFLFFLFSIHFFSFLLFFFVSWIFISLSLNRITIHFHVLRSIDRFNTFKVDQSVFELRKGKSRRWWKTIRKLFDQIVALF